MRNKKFRTYLCTKENRSKCITAGIIAVLSIILFYSYTYSDITATIRMGITLWDNLFGGTIRDFYRTKVYLTTNAYAQDMWASYDFPIYIFFAVWNFPLWLLEHFAGLDVMNNVLCLMWSKTMLIPFVIWMVWGIYHLCLEIKLVEEKALLAVVLFLTSNIFMSSVIIISQYDIIAMCFAMMGVIAYMRRDKKKFILWFALAMPLKYFALFLFLPLLLLMEKRLLHIVADSAIAISLIILFRILIPWYSDLEDSNGESVIQYPFAYTAQIGVDRIYLFFLLMGALLLFCYMIQLDTEDEKLYRYGIYAGFAAYLVQYLTMRTHPYWVIMMIPFLSIMIVQNSEYYFINSFLELFFTWGLLLAQVFKFYWCYDSSLTSGMLWSLILGKRWTGNAVSIVSLIGEYTSQVDKITEHLIGLGSTLFVLTGLALAVINCPVINKKLPVIHYGEAYNNWFLFWRIGSGLILGIIPFVFFVIS